MIHNKHIPINLITMRMSNHAKHSGYDRLIDYMEGVQVLGVAKPLLYTRAIAKVLNPLINASQLQWYNRNSLIEEINSAKGWLKSSNQIFHFLYGENSYRYLGNLKSIKANNSIVCTYHTPPVRFSQVVRTNEHLNKIDAIVAVSKMQVDFLSKFAGPDRTFYVPHGIDVSYFKPAEVSEENERPFKCLFVGSHLRDIETLVETSLLLEKWGEAHEIIAVTAPRNKQLIEKSKNINLKIGISDAELLKLYQDSDILLLPLLDATANNSILEALACGLPIVSTDLEGVRDYVSKESAILVARKDSKSLAESVIQLSRDRTLHAAMRVACRKQAMKYSWEAVVDQLRAIYRFIQD